MMNKILFQLTVTVALFFGAWFGLTCIDWVALFEVEELSETTEQKLGILFWEEFKNKEIKIDNTPITQSIDSIITHVCATNDIDPALIKLHVLSNPEINAFALPDGHLVIYSGLISNAQNLEELSGVICHEIAHIEHNHVMQKLINQLGLSVLIAMTTGSGGPEFILETAKMLSSTAFDRSLEKEADLQAVDYPINAKINPECLANFLYKQAASENEITPYLNWISTHPDSKQRAAYIIEHCPEESLQYIPPISDSTWSLMQHELEY